MTARPAREALAIQVRADAARRTMREALPRSVAAEGQSQARTRVDPTAGVWRVGLAGLWKLVKAGIAHRRGLREVALVARQLELIRATQALGCDAKQATQGVERLRKGLRTRPDNDPVLQRLLKMVSP